MQKQSKSWKDMTAGERKAVLVGWVAIVVVAGWFFLPTEESKPHSPPAAEVAMPDAKTPAFTTPSPEALAAATQIMAELNETMRESSGVVKNGDIGALGVHSRRFNELVATTRNQFGATISDPLGRCGIASDNARSWWHAQLAAVRNNGVEPIPGAIKEALDQYQGNRVDCLESAGKIAKG